MEASLPEMEKLVPLPFFHQYNLDLTNIFVDVLLHIYFGSLSMVGL